MKDGKPTDPEGTICYTDGSKIEEGPTAYGYLIDTKLPDETLFTGSGSLGPHAPVFHGEIFAVHEAARCLQNIDHSPVHFFIDSKAAIRALTKTFFVSKTVLNCYSALLKLAKENLVMLHWVCLLYTSPSPRDRG